MKYTLRPYQTQAVSKLLWSIRSLPDPDVCVLPTGAGKSLVISELANALKQSVLILQPRKEILEQNMEKLKSYVPKSEIGVYSASMGQKDFGFYTFATIGSIYKKPQDFSHFKQVIIDECHLVNSKEKAGMYMRFFKNIGNPKVVGFTATPYRQDQITETLASGFKLRHTVTKIITRVRPKDSFWRNIIYNVNIGDLISAGYLSPILYMDKSIIQHENIPTNKSKSDFDLEAYEQKIADKQQEILEAVFFAEELGTSVLVFCSSVAQATWLSSVVPGSKVVTAKTPGKERAQIVSDFKEHRTKTVFNVGIFDIGFDHPSLDCILLLRPTRSIGKYYQMVGRGVRKSDSTGKKFCRVIDMTGTVKVLGRIETIRMEKRDKWELESETGSWHNKVLYSFMIPQA